MSENIKTYNAKYVGGHVEYPAPKDCKVFVYDDRIELHFHDGYDYKPTIVVPYQLMANIESANEDKISAFRVAMLGIIGGLWKKKHVYTVIQHKDEIGEKTIVLDFGNKVEEAQALIYHKMLDSRKLFEFLFYKQNK